MACFKGAMKGNCHYLHLLLPHNFMQLSHNISVSRVDKQTDRGMGHGRAGVLWE